MDSTTVSVPTRVRLRLAHGVLEQIARDAGASILHVKGVALHPLLAEGRSGSSDCDVLVRPDRVTAMCRALESVGWNRVTSFEHGSVFTHAATFHHALWGTVDVHRAFPGLDRNAKRTFDLLWISREEVDLGGVPCPTPALLQQRLLLLVHAARDASAHGHHDVSVSWDQADAGVREDLDALADRLGATVPLAIATGRPERAEGLPGEHLWTALRDRGSALEVRRAMLRDARGPLAKGRLLLSALQVNPDHLALRLGRRPTRGELRQEWFARWGRVLTRRG